MESYEDDSLPYIDDTPPDDGDTNPHQYNLKIIENYHNKNRNIEITNRFPNDARNSLSPVAPLADETEFSDKLSGSVEDAKKSTLKDSGMKLVIKGWNSSISIQGLDNKSSITFKRKCEKVHGKVESTEEKSTSVGIDTKYVEKSRKGKWKMLTKSIMLAKTARFERRGQDERYPKYVLLKNEEEELTQVKENYPKMFVFNDKSIKQKRNVEHKPEFSFKKSFKNKTEPIVPLEEILTKRENRQPRSKPKENVKKQKKPLTARNLTVKKEIVVERRESLTTEKIPLQSEGCTLTHGQVYNEIQDIFEDTLKLLPQGSQPQPSEEQHLEYYNSIPSQFCQVPCHDPYCCLLPHSQLPKRAPACDAHGGHTYRTPNTQSKFRNQETETEEPTEREVDLAKLQFGILSSFFPRVVIMNAIPSDDFKNEEEIKKETELKNYELPKTEKVKDLDDEEDDDDDDKRPTESLEVPRQDLTCKSKMVPEVVKPEPVMENFYLDDVTLKEFACFDEDQGNKSQGSEATEYLNYTEFDAPGNESVECPKLLPSPPSRFKMKKKEDESLPIVNKYKIEDVDEKSENLSLTKIGYKMYDNLTKLTLNREKEMTKKAEVNGCGCNGNGTKRSPYNITLQSSSSVVKVTVPENDLNFQIVNSEGEDIQIGVISGGKGKKEEREEKKFVRKEELWHPDDGRRALILRREGEVDSSNKASQKLKVSLADNRELVFSIEMNDKRKAEEKPKEKLTKEMKVGTDDFDLAGGDFVCALEGNYKNLSPRLGQILKHLHEKLEIDQKERKFLDEKINQKLIDQKFQKGILPGVFLVKQISPRVPAVKYPAEISTFGKPTKKTEKRAGQLREYYCEECLATMRIFEDENPSVKSMVDKFETIIQLESY